MFIIFFLENNKYKKPTRPCLFCGQDQSRLKRHILTKHKDNAKVLPLLKFSRKEQDRVIGEFRRQAIRQHNIKCLDEDRSDFQRERKTKMNENAPVMCSGCYGFFDRSYKARHQLICPANSVNMMLPMVSIDLVKGVETFSDDFKTLLNSLRLDEIGDCIKGDEIILMIGNRSYNSLKRKQDKKNRNYEVCPFTNAFNGKNLFNI